MFSFVSVCLLSVYSGSPMWPLPMMQWISLYGPLAPWSSDMGSPDSDFWWWLLFKLVNLRTPKRNFWRWHIQFPSGWYVFYWNAFLCHIREPTWVILWNQLDTSMLSTIKLIRCIFLMVNSKRQFLRSTRFLELNWVDAPPRLHSSLELIVSADYIS